MLKGVGLGTARDENWAKPGVDHVGCERGAEGTHASHADERRGVHGVPGRIELARSLARARSLSRMSDVGSDTTRRCGALAPPPLPCPV